MKRKIDEEWIKTSDEWKENNPADFDGYRYCIVGGGALSDGKGDALGGLQFNLGHNYSRAREPGRKYDQTNLYAICPRHNREQGSMSLKEYSDTNPSKRCGP